MIIQGNALAIPLRDNSVDAIITDPPYGLTANKKGGSGAASVNLDSPYGRGRIGIGLDLNRGYIDIGRERTAQQGLKL